MNPALIAAMNFLMGSKRKSKTTPKQTEQFKREVEKVNGMGLYSALKYAKNK
jgi:hypothetical protein